MGLSDELIISSRVACKQQSYHCIGSTCLSTGVAMFPLVHTSTVTAMLMVCRSSIFSYAWRSYRQGISHPSALVACTPCFAQCTASQAHAVSSASKHLIQLRSRYGRSSKETSLNKISMHCQQDQQQVKLVGSFAPEKWCDLLNYTKLHSIGSGTAGGS